MLLYAEEGAFTRRVGFLTRRRGKLTLPLMPGIKGKGTLVAYLFRGKVPVGHERLARFLDAASNGSERVANLRLKGSLLTWSPVCGASSYTITAAHGRAATTTRALSNRLTLTDRRRPITLTVTALDFRGGTVARLTRTFRH